MRKLISKTLVALAISAPLVAQAANFEPGFYGVVSAGQTEIEYTRTTSFSGNGWGIGVGYEFSKYFAVEGMYGNLFHLEIRDGGSTTSYDVDGIALRAIAKYPVSENFIPFVSIGSLDVTESIRVSNTTYNASGNLTTYGIGAEIPLDGKIVLRLLVESADNKNIEGATVAHIGLMTRF